MSALRLTEAIIAAGVPIRGVSIGEEGSAPSVTVVPAGLQSAAQATINAFDWSVNAERAWQALRDRGELIAAGDLGAKGRQALMLVLLDELNLHALKINSILDAVDGATTLAQLKAAVLLITDYPQRTRQQLVTALTNKVNAGDVD